MHNEDDIEEIDKEDIVKPANSNAPDFLSRFFPGRRFVLPDDPQSQKPQHYQQSPIQPHPQKQVSRDDFFDDTEFDDLLVKLSTSDTKPVDLTKRKNSVQSKLTATGAFSTKTVSSNRKHVNTTPVLYNRGKTIPVLCPDVTPPVTDPLEVKKWIFPTNFVKREYQFAIIEKCLFENTLVCLPTGLGKTFIAAVVMLNFYRWFPHSKIVFLAPTRPLVKQQVNGCLSVMGISRSEFCELTGMQPQQTRARLWNSCRLFFSTPQVFYNDIEENRCSRKDIVCLIIDEAHKAKGKYQYVTSVKSLLKATQFFRVIGLSASPGKDTQSIQEVVNNLLISHIEARTSNSPDVSPYIHSKSEERIVVSIGNELKPLSNMLSKVMFIPIRTLVDLGAFYDSNKDHISIGKLISARAKWRENHNNQTNSFHQIQSVNATVESTFAIAIALTKAYSMLMCYGLSAFASHLEKMRTQKDLSRAKQRLFVSPDWITLERSAKDCVSKNVMHPKLLKLIEILRDHFQTHDRDTKAMVFSSFRDSVTEIHFYLLQEQPLIRPGVFVGQSGDGMKQKDQIRLIEGFKNSADFNVLVCTCVGEEGLDIGEVDLCVCYDVQGSPTRLVQRVGRTGRKRDGRVVVLATQGVEEAPHTTAKKKSERVYKQLMSTKNSLVLFGNPPRLIGDDINPIVEERIIFPSNDDIDEVSDKKQKRKNNISFQSEDSAFDKEQHSEMSTNEKSSNESILFSAIGTDELPNFISKSSLNQFSVLFSVFNDVLTAERLFSTQRSQFFVNAVKFTRKQSTSEELFHNYLYDTNLAKNIINSETLMPSAENIEKQPLKENENQNEKQDDERQNEKHKKKHKKKHKHKHKHHESEKQKKNTHKRHSEKEMENETNIVFDVDVTNDDVETEINLAKTSDLMHSEHLMTQLKEFQASDVNIFTIRNKPKEEQKEQSLCHFLLNEQNDNSSTNLSFLPFADMRRMKYVFLDKQNIVINRIPSFKQLLISQVDCATTTSKDEQPSQSNTKSLMNIMKEQSKHIFPFLLNVINPFKSSNDHIQTQESAKTSFSVSQQKLSNHSTPIRIIRRKRVIDTPSAKKVTVKRRASEMLSEDKGTINHKRFKRMIEVISSDENESVFESENEFVNSTPITYNERSHIVQKPRQFVQTQASHDTPDSEEEVSDLDRNVSSFVVSDDVVSYETDASEVENSRTEVSQSLLTKKQSNQSNHFHTIINKLEQKFIVE